LNSRDKVGDMGGMIQRRTVEEIRQLVKQYRERGGVTRGAFCEQHGIPLSTMGHYMRRYGQGAKARVRLTKVEVESGESPARFVLVLANGRRIECGESDLKQLLRVAEGM
jgi:hypothetical protein